MNASSLSIQADYIGKAFEAVNSTGTGASVLILCSALSETIPVGGALITNFSDQSNPISTTPIQVADANVGPNGQLVTWTTPNYIDVTISVVANSIDDFMLTAITEAVRKTAGLTSPGTPPPLFSLTVVYPNAIGQSRLFSNGVLIRGEIGNAMATNARITSKSYTFRFNNGEKTQGNGGFQIA